MLTCIEFSMYIQHHSGGNSVHPDPHHVLYPLFENSALLMVIFLPEYIFTPSLTRLLEFAGHPFCSTLSIIT